MRGVLQVSVFGADSTLMEQQIVYVTGFNASGKTTMGQTIARKHQGWCCVDGDELVNNDPVLSESFKGACRVISLMQGHSRSTRTPFCPPHHAA